MSRIKIMQTALLEARKAVREMIQDQGVKLSYVKSKDISKAARDLVRQDPGFLERAKASLRVV